MDKFKDYYSILGVDSLATGEEIKATYRALSHKFHPDKNRTTDTKELMQEINEAYAILKDEEKRKRYDEEYFKFKHATPRRAEGGSTWTYDYDIQDETVKEDIKNARAYAKELVDQFFNSLKETSVVAAKGAWNSAKGALIGVVVFLFIGLFIRICALNHDLKSYSTPLAKVVLPSTWTTYKNHYFSIAVPETMELRKDEDEYTQLMKDIGTDYGPDITVFQQKGLSIGENLSDDQYSRVIIQYFPGEPGDFLSANQTLPIEGEWKEILEELLNHQLGIYELVGRAKYRWIELAGAKAIEIAYQRTAHKGGPTTCRYFLFFNNDEAVQLSFAYKESMREKWEQQMDTVLRTFRWL